MTSSAKIHTLKPTGPAHRLHIYLFSGERVTIPGGEWESCTYHPDGGVVVLNCDDAVVFAAQPSENKYLPALMGVGQLPRPVFKARRVAAKKKAPAKKAPAKKAPAKKAPARKAKKAPAKK
jgi:hypothetical protein